MVSIVGLIGARVLRASVIAALLLALALIGGEAAFGGGGRIPRAHLEVGEKSRTGYVSGSWSMPTDHGTCATIIVDPPPGAPRALAVPAGRHRMKVVFRKRTRPERALVSVVRTSGRENQRRVRLVPRRNQAGTIVAWEARFRAKLRKRLDIYATGVWPEVNGCGDRRLTWWFRLRASI